MVNNEKSKIHRIYINTINERHKIREILDN